MSLPLTTKVNWKTCEANYCSGVRVDDRRCLKHVTDGSRATLIGLSGDIDLRGVEITSDLWEECLCALPSRNGHHHVGNLRLSRATVKDAINVSSLRVWGDAVFDRCTFLNLVRFVRCTFTGAVSFQSTDFREPVEFRRVKLLGASSFQRCIAPKGFSMSGAWNGRLVLDGARVSGPLRVNAHRNGTLELNGVRATDHVELSGNLAAVNARDATFGDSFSGRNLTNTTISLRGITVSGRVDFTHLSNACSISVATGTFRDGLSVFDARLDRLHMQHVFVTRRVSLEQISMNAPSELRMSVERGGLRMRNVSCRDELRLKLSVEYETKFDRCEFDARVNMIRSEFHGYALMHSCSFTELNLSHVRCERRVTLTNVIVARVLTLQSAVAAEQLDLDIDTSRIDLSSATLERGGRIRLARPEGSVFAEGAQFAGPTVITGATVTSLRASDVSSLVLSNCDLTRCLFGGSHNLAKMRLEEGVVLGCSPGRPRWTPRRVIYEETIVRTQQKPRSGWSRSDGSPPIRVGSVKSRDVAIIYRSLRRGQEDASNAPGAADNFYGEMEMRRLAARWAGGGASIAEHLVLSAYWLFSGYGLRASRAFLALAVVLLLGAFGFSTYGFANRDHPLEPQPSAGQMSTRPPPGDLPDSVTTFASAVTDRSALLYAAESVVPVSVSPTPGLTNEGRALRLVLRVLGPVLLGLGLLSLRGRIKR